MQPIKPLLNRIKWDKRENPEQYSIFYFDRISKTLIKINYVDIKRFEDNFIIVNRNNEEVNIPMHRIKKVKKDEKIIWKR